MLVFEFFRKEKNRTQQSSEFIAYNFTDAQLGSFLDEAIAIFLNNKNVKKVIEDFDLLTDHDTRCTNALYQLIPITLSMELYNEARYPNYYAVYKGINNLTKHYYAYNQMYNVLQPSIKNKCDEGRLSNDEVYAILQHSSTFYPLNKALHTGLQLQDLEFPASIFYDI